MGQSSDDGGDPTSNDEFEDSDGRTRYESNGVEEVEYDMDQWTDLRIRRCAG